jgi:chromosome segregation ATPase
MDDSTRYKSSFATAQTIGATKENILSSAKHYLKVLSDEQSKFQDALKGQRERNLTGKQDEIKQLGTTIDQKQKDIEKLKSDIETHRQRITSLEQEISAAADKLGQTADDFDATYKALVSQIQSDVQNIESHL